MGGWVRLGLVLVAAVALAAASYVAFPPAPLPPHLVPCPTR